MIEIMKFDYTLLRPISMSTLANNLKQLIWEDHINEALLARETGISQPVINRIAKGVTTNPNVDTLRPIANYFRITINQLVGDTPLPSRDARHNLRRGLVIPVIQWHEASAWRSLHENYPTQQTTYAEIATSPHAYGLVIKDTTMEPRFTAGSVIIVDPDLIPQDRDLAIIQIGEAEPVFKQILFDGKETYLKSLNTDFKIMHLTSAYQTLGVVVEAHIYLHI